MPCLRLLFGILRESVLFQQRHDLLAAPQVVVHLALIVLPHRGKLNCVGPNGVSKAAATAFQGRRDGGSLLFSLLRVVLSIVLLSTLTAIAQASFREQSSL